MNRWLTNNKEHLAVLLAIIILSAAFLPIMASINSGGDHASVGLTPIITLGDNSPLERNITIINVYSYPTVGDNWTVMFTTIGQANLTITAGNGTSWTNDDSGGYDLQFLEIKSGNEALDYSWINGSVVVENYSSNEIGYEVSQVLTSGKHTLRFQFGDDIEYAFNDASNWWNTNWAKRSPINLNTSSDTTPSDYQVLLNITYDSNMNNNFSDLRFINYTDNTTELDYWIENKSDGNWANIWVEFGNPITTTNKTHAWVYYNNSGVSNNSNGTNTFIFFDDFSGDLSKWTAHKTSGVYPRIENGTLICGGGSTTSPYGHTALGSNATYFGFVDGILEADIYPSTDAIAEIAFRGNYTANAGYKGRWDARSGTEQAFYKPPYTDGSWSGFGPTQARFGTPNQWQKGKLAINDTTFRIYNNSNLEATATGDTDYAGPGEIALMNHYGSYSIYDNVRVRKYASSEPTYYIGNEMNVTDTSVDTISPYTVTYSPYTITATAASSLNNVTLYYRFSTDNASWGSNVSWNNDSNPDTESPWQWSFNFTNGTGYYEFYSIGKLSGSSDESAPVSADAICYFNESINTPPDVALVTPSPNGTTGVTLQPVCRIWANDSEGDTLDIYWYENTTGGFVLRNTNLSVSPNQTFSYTFTEFDDYSTTYYWKVAVNDSMDNTTAVYYFTTAAIGTSVDTISPYLITSSPFNITATGPSDLDNVTLYYRYSDDNVSWGTTGVSIFDGFESGSMNASLWATYQTPASDARIQFNYGDTTQSGSYACAMDDFDADTGDSASNELYTVYDFTGASNINIDFWQYDADDEETDVGNSWSGHVDCDAVSFTNDGNTWYEIIDAAALNSNDAWSHYTYNISNDPDFNSDVNSSFAIKFQQFDNYQIDIGQNWDGRVWDDIYINFTGIDSDTTDWIVWSNVSNPDGTYPWNWSFNFPNSTGYYEFYSIGNKSGSPNESAPASADAICRYVLPTIPTVTTNASTGVEETNATLWGYLSDDGFATTTCGFRYGTSSGSYSENFTKGTYPSGTEFSNNNGSLTQGQIYFYQAWASNSVGFANGTEVAFLTKPEAPTNLTAQTNSSSIIYLTWVQGIGANNTYIERNTTASWSRGDGTLVYNGTSTSYEDNSGLTEDTTYYYQAWSYTNWTYNPTIHQWSDTYDSANNRTNSTPTITLISPSPNGTTGISIQPVCSIWANDSDLDTLDVYWYENTTGSWVLRNTNISVSANSTVSYTFTEFDNYSKICYWKVAVNDSMDNTTAVYYFTTGAIGTSVDTISPYIVTYSPFNITATGPSDLDSVTLWYRYSDDNATWVPTPQQVTFDAAGAGAAGTGSSITPGYPAGLEENDLMILHIMVLGTSEAPNTPTGWTLKYGPNTTGGNDGRVWVFYKFSSGSETGTLTVSGMGTAAGKFARIYSFNNVDLSEPFGSGGGWETSTANIISDVGVTTTGLREYAVNLVAVGEDANNYVSFAGETGGDWTELVAQYSNAAGADGTLQIQGATMATAGTINGGSYNMGANDPAGVRGFSLKPMTWRIWNNASNPDDTYPWNWSFNFPNDTGYYEFFSIGNKSGSPNESSPVSADAICYYNTSMNNAPTIALINPAPNGTTDVSLQPVCSIWANDSDLDTLDVYWYENTTGSWVLRNTNSSVAANSIVNYTFTEFSNYSTTYYWKVAVNDSTDNTTAIYHFTIRPSNFPPTIAVVSPANESTGITLQPVCRIWANDSEGDTLDIYWYENTTGSFVLRNTNLSVSPNQTFSYTFTEFDDYSTTYYWKVEVNDSNSTTAIYHFTTEPIGTSVDTISPYTITSTPFTLTATGPSDLDNVTLYYRYSDDNSSWGNRIITYIDNSEASATDNAVAIINKPAGTQEDDLMFAILISAIGGDGDGSTMSSAPSGWTEEHNYTNAAPSGQHIYIYWKIANNSEGASYTWTWTDAGCSWVGQIMTFRGVDTSDPIHVEGTVNQETSDSPMMPNITTTVDNCMVLIYGMCDDEDADADGSGIPGGATWIDTTTDAGDFGLGLSTGYFVQTIAGGTGDQDWTFDASEENSGQQYAFKPAISGTNWTIWSNSSNPDGTYPWSWDFDFPNSTGYYEFYSIGNKSGSPNESAPVSADAICYFNAPTAPVINSYDLLNGTGSKLNNATGSLDVNTEYYFTINVTDSDGWDSIEYINITTWYDNGNDSSTYNQTQGGNLNMFLQYKNTTGTANWSMIWPDDEATLILGNCTETIISSTTRIINISFKPLSQICWADSNNSWSGIQNTTNDIYSWNFNITVTDSAGENTWKVDEYGVHKYTSILPDSDWVDVYALPGFYDESSVVTITYSSNYNYNMTIYFEENLTHATMPVYYIPIANNVTILADADLNDDITYNINFTGLLEANAVDIFNTSGLFQPNGSSQTVQVQFRVYIPFGTMGGKYTARVATKISHD